MFKTRELRRYAFYANSQWSGGVYVVPTMSGSRGAVGISGAWYSMMALGRKKY
jgi:sphinganine-1-phosphate aldolase